MSLLLHFHQDDWFLHFIGVKIKPQRDLPKINRWTEEPGL